MSLGHLKHIPVKLPPNRENGRVNLEPEIMIEYHLLVNRYIDTAKYHKYKTKQFICTRHKHRTTSSGPANSSTDLRILKPFSRQSPPCLVCFHTANIIIEHNYIQQLSFIVSFVKCCSRFFCGQSNVRNVW